MALVAALRAQTVTERQIVVVDDGSRDATARAAAAANVEVVRLERSVGAYAARNAGLERATAPVVAVTDADCRPAPDWLAQGLAALEAGGADLVGGRIDMALSPEPTLAEVLDVAWGLDQRRCVEDWGFAATANLLVRRRVLDAIGPFNPRLRSGGDDEFSKRAVAAGFRLAYAPEAAVAHVPRRRGRAVARKALRVGRGGGRLRHHGSGPVAQRPRLWTDLRRWRPRADVPGLERAVAQGYELTPLRRARLLAAQYAWVQLPTVLGDLSADLRP